MKRRIRRKLKRRNPAIRRQPQASGARAAPERDGGLMVGGAHDPAERAADAMAARALSGQPATATPAAGPAPVQRDAAAPRVAPGSAAAPAPASASRAIGQLGPGRPLAATERAEFEPRFGQSFAGVRLHEGDAADRATRALDARAFTAGSDIAFAPGARDRPTMAHELAHVAQGDAGVRRKIRTDITTGTTKNIGYKLKHDYKVTGFTHSGQDWTMPSANRSGGMNTEIASAMLASTRTFTLKGDHLHKAEASLRAHLKARRAAVRMAKAVKVEFSTSKDDFMDGVLKFVSDEAKKRAKVQFLSIPALRKKSKADQKAILRKMYISHLVAVMQSMADDPKFKAVAKEIVKNSKAWQKHKTGLRPYSAACFVTTATVMFGGGGKLQEQHITPGSYKDIKKSAFWHDWVPGDWGYVQNPDPNPAPGLEGENIIYIGKNKFWAHFDPSKPIRTLTQVADMVASWNADNKYIMKTRRRYPLAGLK